MSDFRERVSSGLGSLLDRARADETPLSHVSERELEAELAERRKHKADRKPEENPRAKNAGAGASARAAREKAASLREKKVHGERDKRERAERKAHEAAFRQAKAQADRAKQVDFDAWKRSATGRGASSSSSSGGSRKRRRSPASSGDKIAEYYKVLDVPYGAEIDEVKKAYRKLMRKYHPDLHRESEKKQKAATELTVKVTEAYNELEKHLKGG